MIKKGDDQVAPQISIANRHKVPSNIYNLFFDKKKTFIIYCVWENV